MIKNLFKGVSCKTDIGADGESHIAFGRYLGKHEEDNEIAIFITPHGSMFEIEYSKLEDIITKEDRLLLRHFEALAKSTEGVILYGGKLDDMSYNSFIK